MLNWPGSAGNIGKGGVGDSSDSGVAIGVDVGAVGNSTTGGVVSDKESTGCDCSLVQAHDISVMQKAIKIIRMVHFFM